MITDSVNVVAAITDSIFKCRDNSFRKSDAHVVNQELLEKLNRKLESLDEEGVTVEYWRVERSDNKSADKLARAACG